MTLSELKPGQVAVVTGYGAEGNDVDNATARRYRAKLLALGLTRGAKVRFIHEAPLGDPIEIEVRGFHLSLRKDEASVLNVRQIMI